VVSDDRELPRTTPNADGREAQSVRNRLHA
jgi:hypothetical protein